VESPGAEAQQQQTIPPARVVCRRVAKHLLQTVAARAQAATKKVGGTAQAMRVVLRLRRRVARHSIRAEAPRYKAAALEEGGASGGISASGGGSTTGGTAGGGTAGTSSRATGSAGGSTGVGGQQAACGSLAGTDIWKLPTFQVAAGPYKADWKALGLSYSTPQWWRDAKLGAWAHWDPQSMPEHRRFKRHYAFMSDKNHYVACTRLRHQTIPLPRNEGIDHEGRRVARRRSPRVRWADLGQGYDLFFSRFPSMRTAETRQNPWSNRRFVTARIGRGAR
jgi:hypothetical protein